jgi:3-phenylpropionate/cinnamic acid dioxygenase small subunit
MSANADRFLLDKHEIEQVYYRYCEVIDSKVFEDLDEVFITDAVGDYQSANGNLDQGLASLVTRLKRGMGPQSDCGPTQHNVMNVRVEVDGDTATSKAHFYAVHRGINNQAGQIYTCWGQYDDTWVRTPMGWRIRHRDYQNFLTEGPVAVIRATRPAAD